MSNAPKSPQKTVNPLFDSFRFGLSDLYVHVLLFPAALSNAEITAILGGRE